MNWTLSKSNAENQKTIICRDKKLSAYGDKDSIGNINFSDLDEFYLNFYKIHDNKMIDESHGSSHKFDKQIIDSESSVLPQILLTVQHNSGDVHFSLTGPSEIDNWKTISDCYYHYYKVDPNTSEILHEYHGTSLDMEETGTPAESMEYRDLEWALNENWTNHHPLEI